MASEHPPDVAQRGPETPADPFASPARTLRADPDAGGAQGVANSGPRIAEARRSRGRRGAWCVRVLSAPLVDVAQERIDYYRVGELYRELAALS